METKTCPKCKHSLPMGEFWRDSSLPSGRKSWCKACSYEGSKRPKVRARKRKTFAAWVKRTDYYNKRRNSDSGFRLRVYLRTRVWAALKKNLRGWACKSAPTVSLLGCSIDDLKLHLESGFRAGMTWDNYGRVWEIDHIMPCAEFDLSDPAQQIACFHYKNLQPLFAEENRKKNRKVIENAHQTA